VLQLDERSLLVCDLLRFESRPDSGKFSFFSKLTHCVNTSKINFTGGGAGSLLGPTDSASLPTWVLDGKDEVAPLLKFTFPQNLAKCIVMLCATLDQPGNIMPALRRWYRQLDDQIRQHYQPEEILAAKQARGYWLIYTVYRSNL
jgi:hypothetical protein